jgi:hypothetical protein
VRVLLSNDREIAHTLLQTVIKKGGHHWPDICKKIDDQHAHLWLVVDDKPIAALVTQVAVDDTLECLLAGGARAKEWAQLAEKRLSNFAILGGLYRLRFIGRRGWRKIFPKWDAAKSDDEGLLVMERYL